MFSSQLFKRTSRHIHLVAHRFTHRSKLSEVSGIWRQIIIHQIAYDETHEIKGKVCRFCDRPDIGSGVGLEPGSVVGSGLRSHGGAAKKSSVSVRSPDPWFWRDEFRSPGRSMEEVASCLVSVAGAARTLGSAWELFRSMSVSGGGWVGGVRHVRVGVRRGF